MDINEVTDKLYNLDTTIVRMNSKGTITFKEFYKAYKEKGDKFFETWSHNPTFLDIKDLTQEQVKEGMDYLWAYREAMANVVLAKDYLNMFINGIEFYSDEEELIKTP